MRYSRPAATTFTAHCHVTPALQERRSIGAVASTQLSTCKSWLRLSGYADAPRRPDEGQCETRIDRRRPRRAAGQLRPRTSEIAQSAPPVCDLYYQGVACKLDSIRTERIATNASREALDQLRTAGGRSRPSCALTGALTRRRSRVTFSRASRSPSGSALLRFRAGAAELLAAN